jgi:nucleoside-diphosphate-sugar epimerase
VTSINRLMHARGRGEPGLAGARAAFEANIMGTFDVLAWAAHLPALDRFITVSSGAVYADDGPEPLPEDGYVAPAEAYPITKRVGELLTGLAVREAGLPAISVRLSGVFGPMDRVTAVRDVRCAPYVIVHRALGSRLVRVSALEAVGDFIHAEDVADALLTLLALGCPAFPVYNIAYGTTVSVADLLAWTAEKVPGLRHAVTDAATADVVLDPALRRARWGAYDIARITAETGWRPRPMREALHSYVDWVRENE